MRCIDVKTERLISRYHYAHYYHYYDYYIGFPPFKVLNQYEFIIHSIYLPDITNMTRRLKYDRFRNNNNNSIAEFFDAVNRFVNYGASWLSRIQGVAKVVLFIQITVFIKFLSKT